MADIKKSFNFRNGLQVDDDNFIINRNGLVGIGSTVPTERLDVDGNLKISGTITCDTITTQTLNNTGNDGTSSFSLVTVGVTSITTGIITATGTGIVTYYGDARYLQGMPTSQWQDMDVGLGFTSIYNTGNVGVGTTDPRYTLQVGSTNSSSILTEGVGISSSGYIDLTGGINASSSGIVTANRFVGSGASLTSLNASQLTSGSIPANAFGSINTSSGIITASEVKATTFTGTLVGVASTARELISTAEVDIAFIDSDFANIGFGTFSNTYVSGKIGIGSTTTTPLADVHVDTDGIAAIKIQSYDNESRLILGRNDNITNSFAIVTDDVSSSVVDSGLNSVDIVNYNPGNINFLLYPNNVEGRRFNWINKYSNSRLMSLTQTGELGIGITNPTHKFHVVGTSTVTEDSFVGRNLEVVGLSTFYKGVGFGSDINVSGIFKITDKIGIGLTSGDGSLLTQDLQVGFGQTMAFLSKSGDGKFTGIVTATKFAGIGSDLTLIDPTNISPGTITATETNAPFNINTLAGIITASKFVGIGSDLTFIDPTNISPGTITATESNAPFNINTSSGIITASKFVGSGESLTSVPMSALTAGDIDANININAGTGIITATRFVGSGASLTNLSASALATGGETSAAIKFTGVTTFTGNVSMVNVDINSGGIITSGNFSGNGADITNLTSSELDGSTQPNGIDTNENIRLGLLREDSHPPSIVMANKEASQGINTHSVGSISVGFSTHVTQSGVSSEIWQSALTDLDEVGINTIVFRDNYYSTDYQILAINGTNYQTSKVLVLYDGGSVVGIETYSNININNQIARYQVTVATSGVGRTMSLNAIPESGITGLTTYKVHFSSIH